MRNAITQISGLATSAMTSMQPTSTRMSLPYSKKISGPLSDSVVYTRPITPNGAQAMIHRTMVVTASEMALKTSLDVSDASQIRVAADGKAFVKQLCYRNGRKRWKLI